MAKRNFIGRIYGEVYDGAEQTNRKARRTYSEEEKEYYMNSGRTHGRKGLKITRINMAFTPDLYDYIQTMAKATGQTMTGIVNAAVRMHMKENRQTYETIVALRHMIDDKKDR